MVRTTKISPATVFLIVASGPATRTQIDGDGDLIKTDIIPVIIEMVSKN
jgi:hypothetical protein